MIVSTAPTLEGSRIVVHAGLVPGEAAMGADIFRDPFAAVRDIVGVRAGACERVPKDARDVAIGEMTNEAASRGANAAVGVDLDYEVLGDRGSMLTVSADGTAVAVEQRKVRLLASPVMVGLVPAIRVFCCSSTGEGLVDGRCELQRGRAAADRRW